MREIRDKILGQETPPFAIKVGDKVIPIDHKVITSKIEDEELRGTEKDVENDDDDIS